MSHSVDAVKTALVELMVATFAADTDAVQVTDGPVDTATTLLERVVEVGEVVGSDVLDSMDLGTTGDTYTVTVTCSVTLKGPGDETQRLARTAVLGLWDRARKAVREEPTGQLDLEASGVLGVRVAPEWRLREYPMQEGRSASLVWGVLVIAQAT